MPTKEQTEDEQYEAVSAQYLSHYVDNDWRDGGPVHLHPLEDIPNTDFNTMYDSPDVPWDDDGEYYHGEYEKDIRRSAPRFTLWLGGPAYQYYSPYQHELIYAMRCADGWRGHVGTILHWVTCRISRLKYRLRRGSFDDIPF